MKVLTDDPQRCINWLQMRLNLKFVSPACAYGILDDSDQIKAAVVFTDWTGQDCHINLAGRAALSRMALRINANIPFVQLGCRRLTAFTRPHRLTGVNAMTALMGRLGFEKEGRLRKYYSDDEDAIIWGMLKEECPWF